MNKIKNLLNKLRKTLILSSTAYLFYNYTFNNNKYLMSSKTALCLRTNEKKLTVDGKVPEYFDQVNIEELEKNIQT